MLQRASGQVYVPSMTSATVQRGTVYLSLKTRLSPDLLGIFRGLSDDDAYGCRHPRGSFWQQTGMTHFFFYTIIPKKF